MDGEDERNPGGWTDVPKRGAQMRQGTFVLKVRGKREYYAGQMRFGVYFSKDEDGAKWFATEAAAKTARTKARLNEADVVEIAKS
jgi:hypothetical protein